MTADDYITLRDFHALLQARMGADAPAFRTFETWAKPSYQAKHPRMKAIFPAPRRLVIGHAFRYRRSECEAFAEDLLTDARPARAGAPQR